MSAVLPGWRYADHIPDERRKRLLAPGSFEALVAAAAEDIRVISARVDPGREGDVRGCNRLMFRADMPLTFDQLFNGPWGYRAQYWQSADKGLASNAKLMEALAPKLMAAVKSDMVPKLGKADPLWSLTCTSSKFWIDEGFFPVEPYPRDLDIARWAEEAESGNKKALQGLCAPQTTRAKLMGAFVSVDGVEVVPRDKRRRHWDIYSYGFS